MALLLDETAVVRLPAGVVRVTGPDRLTYLHTLLSQYLQDARPGTVADFLHLDAKGNPQAAGRAVVHAEHVLLVTPPEVAADLAAALEKFKFLTQVEAADASDEFALASVRGPKPVALSAARDEPMTAVPHGDGLVVRDRSGGVDLLGTPEWVGERVAGLGLPDATMAEWEAWRIRHGVPGWRTEISTGRRAQELGLLPTHVHLKKGCYPGQESIAKIYNLGRPRRTLAVVAFDGPVSEGASLAAEGGAKPGTVTSTAPTDDGAVALALLPVDRDGRVPEWVTADGVTGRVLRRVGEGMPIPGA
ncbi:MAG TPA: hypothetical protein VM324_15080 [Egibacteraceae bacterium]|nr:hypothetical protein [Egibacteraceae bacterium]